MGNDAGKETKKFAVKIKNPITKELIKKIVLCISNPRLLLCLGIAWMITNGWSYIVTAIGGLLGIEWLTAVGGAYLAFLWLPVSPEKLVTLALAIFLLKKLFPGDTKTLGVLHELHMKAKGLHEKRKKDKQTRDTTDEPQEITDDKENNE